jgi:mannitol/fructose-specific phosphotransferase system IIA component (Ntr-type)
MTDKGAPVPVGELSTTLEETASAQDAPRPRTLSQLFQRDMDGKQFLPNIRELLEKRLAQEEMNLSGSHNVSEADNMSHLIVHELLAKLSWTPPAPQAAASQAAPQDLSGYYQVMEEISRLLSSRGAAIFNIPDINLDGILGSMLEAAKAKELLPAEHVESVKASILAREKEFPDAIGDTFNVLVGTHECFSEGGPALVFCTLARPANFDAPDGLPTRFFWLLLGPPAMAREMVTLGEGTALLMSDARFHDEAVDLASPAALVQLVSDTAAELRAALEAAVDGDARARLLSLLPEAGAGAAAATAAGAAGVDVEAGVARRVSLRDATPVYLDTKKYLEPSGAPWYEFRAVRREFNDRVRKHYAAEWSDPFNKKTVSATLFLFWACITPAIAFGALHSELTSDFIGIIETIAASAVLGIAYSITSGMPLVIIGGTGPIVIFTGVLFQLCETLDINFLTCRWWVGFWCFVFSLYMAGAETCKYVQYITQFTDEIFAGLISVIFIVSAIKPLAGYFTKEHDSCATSPNLVGCGTRKYDDAQALLSATIAISTCWLTMTLKGVRKSIYLRGSVRDFLADFSSVMAILAMTMCDRLLLPGVKTPELEAPDQPTQTTLGTTIRPWLVDPFEFGRLEITEACRAANNCVASDSGGAWVIGFAILPALLAMVLIFLDDVITWNIINKRDNKIRHGRAYHYETLVMGAMTFAASIVGAPWLVAATVRSINHVQALASKEEVVVHGHVHEHIRHVHETRCTGFFIHLLMLLALFVAMPAVKLVTMPVLHGIFLFMGIASLTGNSFVDRFKLFFVEPALYPPTHFIRTVPIPHIFRFTGFQLMGFIVLYVVKSIKEIAIAFPLVILLLAPFRLKIMPKYIEQKWLDVLDEEEDDDGNADNEVQ